MGIATEGAFHAPFIVKHAPMPEYIAERMLRRHVLFFAVNAYQCRPVLAEEPVRLALREAIALARAVVDL